MASAGLASGATHFVGDNNCPGPGTGTWGDPFCTIQSAVDAANAAGGDVIKVRRGVYTESVNIDRGVTIRGVGRHAMYRVIVEANAGGPIVGVPPHTPDNTFTINAPLATVSLQRMMIRNGRYGVRSTAGNTSVRSVKFIHNGYDGAPFPHGAALTMASALAHGGLVAGSHTNNGGAVRIEGAVGSVIAYNKVVENFRGIRCQDCDQASIHHNLAIDNVESGIYLAASATGSTNSTVHRNTVKGNANNGILSIGGKNNVIKRNTVIGSWNAGIQLWFPSEITVRRNAIFHNNRYAFNGIGNPGDAAAGGISAASTLAAPGAFAINASRNFLVRNRAGGATESRGIRIDTDTGVPMPITIKRNTFIGHAMDVLLENQAVATTIQRNRFRHGGIGVQNNEIGVPVAATCNWWGSSNGPTHASNPGGTGAIASDDVDFTPWLITPFFGCSGS